MQVIFKLKKANTNYGDQLHIIGNDDEIGDWNVDKAAPMEYEEGYWITKKPITITREQAPNLEYKYLVARGSIQNVNWESGENRSVNLAQYFDNVGKFEDYRILLEDAGFNCKDKDHDHKPKIIEIKADTQLSQSILGELHKDDVTV